MKKSLSPSRQPKDILRAQQQINARVFAYDRITLWVNGMAKPVLHPLIGTHCGEWTVVPNGCRYHSVWAWQIEIFQPSIRALKMLLKGFCGRRRTKLIYVEFACDLITKNKAGALELRNFLMAHALPKYMRQDVLFVEHTAYFNRRSNVDADLDSDEASDTTSCNKAPRNLVMYADRESKQQGVHIKKPCCHIEWRLHGSQGFKSANVSCLDDLLYFDHMEFWKRNLPLYRLPRKTAIGQLLREGDDEVGDAALRRLVRAFLSEFELDGALVLHNLIRQRPDIKKLLEPIDIELILDVNNANKSGDFDD